MVTQITLGRRLQNCRFHQYFPSFISEKAMEEDSLANAPVFKCTFLAIGNRIGGQKAVYR